MGITTHAGPRTANTTPTPGGRWVSGRRLLRCAARGALADDAWLEECPAGCSATCWEERADGRRMVLASRDERAGRHACACGCRLLQGEAECFDVDQAARPVRSQGSWRN